MVKAKYTRVNCRGCGKSIDIANDFKDYESRVEYTISGLCQECQDKVFTED